MTRWSAASRSPTSAAASRRWRHSATGPVRRSRSRGYITSAAVRACVRYAFEDVDLHRVEAACQPDNMPSRRVLEKAGFTQEGSANALVPEDQRQMARPLAVRDRQRGLSAAAVGPSICDGSKPSALDCSGFPLIPVMALAENDGVVWRRPRARHCASALLRFVPAPQPAQPSASTKAFRGMSRPATASSTSRVAVRRMPGATFLRRVAGSEILGMQHKSAILPHRPAIQDERDPAMSSSSASRPRWLEHFARKRNLVLRLVDHHAHGVFGIVRAHHDHRTLEPGIARSLAWRSEVCPAACQTWNRCSRARRFRARGRSHTAACSRPTIDREDRGRRPNDQNRRQPARTCTFNVPTSATA